MAKRTLASRVGSLGQVVYHNKLGSLGDRSKRVVEIATKIAEDICQHSPLCIKLMKETINLTEHMDLDEGYHVECYATAIIKATPEAKEAVQAALEKRKPNFKRAEKTPSSLPSSPAPTEATARP